jgi:hypothetical protein
VRLAYLGYAACALAVAFFQLEIYASAGVAFMMAGVFLIPIFVAGTLAIGNTVGARSATLRVLGGATVVVVLFLIMTGSLGVTILLTTAIAHAYEVLVLIACIYRRHEWWPQGNRHDA